MLASGGTYKKEDFLDYMGNRTRNMATELDLLLIDILNSNDQSFLPALFAVLDEIKRKDQLGLEYDKNQILNNVA